MANGRHHQDNETYDVINPATEEVIGKASKATRRCSKSSKIS